MTLRYCRFLLLAFMPLVLPALSMATTPVSHVICPETRKTILWELSVPAPSAEDTQTAAQNGDACAMYQVGLANLREDTARGTPADLTAAEQWFRKAAVQGVAQAQLELASLIIRRHPRPVEKAEVFHLVQQAAQAKYLPARRRLAALLDTGFGTAPQRGQALQLWQELAAEGDYGAQQILSGPIEVIPQLRRDAQRGDGAALFQLHLLHKQGMGVESDYQLASTLLDQAIAAGYAPAQFERAQQLRAQLGASAHLDYPAMKPALALIRQAAAQGYAPARDWLTSSAVDWILLRERVEAGEPAAMLELANQKWNAFLASHEPDPRQLLKSAAAKGHAPAQYRLGTAYYHGDKLGKSSSNAAHWLRMAAEQGHADAQLFYGVMLTNGDGVSRNTEEGLRWLKRARANGNPEAAASIAIAEDNLHNEHTSRAPGFLETLAGALNTAGQRMQASQQVRERERQKLALMTAHHMEQSHQAHQALVQKLARERDAVALAQRQQRIATPSSSNSNSNSNSNSTKKLNPDANKPSEKKHPAGASDTNADNTGKTESDAHEREVAERARQQAEESRQLAADEKKREDDEEARRLHLPVPEAVAVCTLAGKAAHYHCYSPLSPYATAVNPQQTSGWRTPDEWIRHVGNCPSGAGKPSSLSDGGVAYHCGYGISGIVKDAAGPAGAYVANRETFYCRSAENYCKRRSPTDK